VSCIREQYIEDNDTDEELDQPEANQGRPKVGNHKRNRGFMQLIDKEKSLLVRQVIDAKAQLKREAEESGDAASANRPPKKNQWWQDEEEVYRPITEWTLQKNECMESLDSQRPPYTP